MKKKYIYLFASLLAANLHACSDIEDGKSNLDNLPDVKQYTFNHPCLLHTQEDFDFVKGKVDAGQSPWREAFTQLEASKYAKSDYVPDPVEVLKRLDQTNWQNTYPDFNNYTKAMYDAAAAYQLALRWKLSGDEAYAKAAVKVLNAWAKTCTGIIKKNGEVIDPNEYLISIQTHQFANAAEIMRSYSGWTADEFTKFKSWIVSVFYPQASLFLARHSTEKCPMHTWANWDLAQMTAILSIGILTDDQDKVNEAILYFKNGVGTGSIANAVPFLHKDKDSNEMLGQGQESGRDQGHATLCISLMGTFCQMAYNIGEDLFAYDNNKVLAMAEYTAKYNLRKDEYKDESYDSDKHADEYFKYSKGTFPYEYYSNCDWECPSISSKESNDASRGGKRPCWELIYNHYVKVKGGSAIYSQAFADQMRPDGGGGNYGPNSGGFDQLGWGTLMFAK